MRTDQCLFTPRFHWFFPDCCLAGQSMWVWRKWRYVKLHEIFGLMHHRIWAHWSMELEQKFYLFIECHYFRKLQWTLLSLKILKRLYRSECGCKGAVPGCPNRAMNTSAARTPDNRTHRIEWSDRPRLSQIYGVTDFRQGLEKKKRIYRNPKNAPESTYMKWIRCT